MKGVVKNKPFRPPEGDESKGQTDKSKGRESNPKRYKGKKM